MAALRSEAAAKSTFLLMAELPLVGEMACRDEASSRNLTGPLYVRSAEEEEEDDEEDAPEPDGDLAREFGSEGEYGCESPWPC